MVQEYKIQQSIYIALPLLERLKTLTKAEGRTVSQVAVELLEAWAKNEEKKQ